MPRRIFFSLAILAFIQFSLGIALTPLSLAQEWQVRRPRGTLKVAELYVPSVSARLNNTEGLVTLDKDNNVVPCLAEDWRWVDDRTIEFKLRKAVTFHNGEKFNADAVRINWEQYRRMQCPCFARYAVLPDETIFEIVDEHMVRFILPGPDALAFGKFWQFPQIAPAFFAEHQFDEGNWGFLPEAGPWGTGPFKLVEGSLRYGRPSERVVLEAYEDYWDPQYPKVQRLIFDNTLMGNRKEAMRLCRETEGAVDIVNTIRPLDTLKIAQSPFAKVVKSKDVAALGGIFNQRKRDSKWRDIRLRRAVNYAINRKELWKYAAKGNAYNLGGSIPPEGFGHNPNLKLYTYDTTKARELLAEAGYPEGFEVKLVTWESWRLEAQIMKRMLERIGLKITLEVMTHPEVQRKLYIPALDKPPEEQDWDIVILLRWDWEGHTGGPFSAWLLIEESEYRWIQYDPVYEEMWKDMARTVDRNAQEEKIRRMEQYIYDRAYLLFIYSPLMLYAVNKEVNFIPYKRELLILKETSVTDNHWSVRGQK
jgi:peptide/nickel transport system substrate-binding protein